MPVSQTAITIASVLGADCERDLRRVLVQIAHRMYCGFDDGFGLRTRCVGHHMIRVELCSTSSRLSLRSTLRASALTTPARKDIRRHAETMACIVIEMYQEQCRVSE